jgi:hypothetical protein
MKKNITLLFISSLLCFIGCKHESSTNNTNDSDGNKAIEALIKTNSNASNNIKQGLSKGNDGETIAKWFPEKLGDYRLDQSKNDIGQDKESRAAVVYAHPDDPTKNITITVWDGNGPSALFVNNMIAMGLDGTGEEVHKEMRQKVYVRNGRKSSERILYQYKQVDITFEVNGRFYVNARSNNNTIETVWEALDLLDFDGLKNT